MEGGVSLGLESGTKLSDGRNVDEIEQKKIKIKQKHKCISSQAWALSH